MKSLLSESVLHGIVVGEAKLRLIKDLLEENFVDVEMHVSCKGGRYFETTTIDDILEYANTEERQIEDIEFRATQLKSKNQLIEQTRIELENRLEDLTKDGAMSRSEAIGSLSDSEQNIVYKLSSSRDKTSIKIYLGSGGTKAGFAGFRIQGDHYRDTDWIVNDVRNVIASLRNPWDDYIWIRLAPIITWAVSSLVVWGTLRWVFAGKKEVEDAQAITWLVICTSAAVFFNIGVDRWFSRLSRSRVPYVVFLIGDQSRMEESMKSFCNDIKNFSLGIITTIVLSFAFLGLSAKS